MTKEYKKIQITIPVELLERAKAIQENNEYNIMHLSPMIHKGLDMYINYLKQEPTKFGGPDILLFSIVTTRNVYEKLKIHCVENDIDINAFIEKSLKESK